MELYIFSFKYTYQRWVRNYIVKWIVIIYRAMHKIYFHPNSHKQCFKFQLQSYMQEITSVITQFRKTKIIPPSNSAAQGRDHSKLSSSLNSFSQTYYCTDVIYFMSTSVLPLEFKDSEISNRNGSCRSQLKNSNHSHIYKKEANTN